MSRWFLCPKCDLVQPVKTSWVEEWEMTNCQSCCSPETDAPYVVPLDDWEITDPTDEEIEKYRKKYE